MAIRILQKEKLFSLEGKHTQYVFSIDENNLVRHLYWGKKINNLEDFSPEKIVEISSNDPTLELTKEEYSPQGGLRYKESCLKVQFQDGTRDIVYSYEGYEIIHDTLIIKIKDKNYDFFKINLYYKIYEDEDILERWTEIKNQGNEDVVVENILSAEFNLPEGEKYTLTNVHGRWAGEQVQFKQDLSYGKTVLESRRGVSNHNHNPYFILDSGANEDYGDVYFAALKYTGNFKIVIENTPYNTTRALIGINDFDFMNTLEPSESFVTPKVICGYSFLGFGNMSRRLNNFALKYVIPEEQRNKIRPVLYNSWEATTFNVKVEEQKKLAKKAQEMGVELFVIDDGWFGRRNSDKDGLGDWYVNKEKFPQGLGELVDYVNSLGMDFGIWVEPEMVNPESDLYKQHPDWVYSFPKRYRNTLRNQLVLNITKREVKDFIITFLDKLLTDYNIKYIKWDANRPISEGGAYNLPKNKQRMLWYKHIESLYQIVDELRKKHPEVSFEACASGGGRIDYGALSHFTEFWTSDNTDALDRLMIQYSYSFIYPTKAMRAWVTDCPNFVNNRYIPLDFRFHSAMLGTLGIGGNINKWSEEELRLAKEKVREYKDIRNIIQKGNLYRLKSPYEGQISAFQYSIKSQESVLFVFLRGQNFGVFKHNINLKDLNENSMYEVIYDNVTYKKSGAYLMNLGIDIILIGDCASKLIKIREI